MDTAAVVITKKGAAFARCVRQASAAIPAAETPTDAYEKAAPGGDNSATNGDARPPAALRPLWDRKRRELCLGDLLVKRFRVPAGNQELVLNVFQEQGWPGHIDDPLPDDPSIHPRTRLNDVVYRLNRKQFTPAIRFRANGVGNGLSWSLRDHGPASYNAAPDGDNSATNGDAQPPAALRPLWDRKRRELCLGDLVVKRFRVPAGNQELVLNVFQEEGWPEHIDDPLPGDPSIHPRTRLNDVVYRLNHKQFTPAIRFRANGHGSGLSWSLCEHRPVQ